MLLVASIHEHAIDRKARSLRHAAWTRVDGFPRGVERELGSLRLVEVEGHAARHMGGVGSGLQDGPPSGVLDDSHELVGLGLAAEANARADDINPAAVLGGFNVGAHLRSLEDC
ncbi:MAG TPA: hypothetical protein VKG05_11875 [Steroidobacteraceae bacterium]|nr:hypothetical protein [Steroidobacteraceae bacterium]